MKQTIFKLILYTLLTFSVHAYSRGSDG